ncbi:ABC transporter permease [Celeribacter indicus]|nr:ABC transporter permease [Celeribacter indicus]SDW91033.1 sulfonate transport system permease protein [Celeribacter indicus]
MTLLATGQEATPRGPVTTGRGWRSLSPALVAPLALLVLWQAATATGLLPEQILPSPSRVVQTFAELAASGELSSAARISFWRLAVGLALGGSLGLVFGLALGASQRVEQWVGPTFRAFAAVPALGWIPVLILLVGIDEMLKVIILTKACFVPVAIASRDAWRAVPPGYEELGQVLGLSPSARFLRIRLPAMVPLIFGGLRLASGQAFVSLVTCEMLAATEGIGYLMIWGRTLFQMDVVIVGMIVVGTAGIALDRTLRLLEHLIRKRMGEDV